MNNNPKINQKINHIKQNSIYLLPNSFTVAALFSAFYAITESFHGRFDTAAIAVFISMLLDGMDGRVARLTNSQSAFGEQLDSLADMVSFGVAPALIVYNWQLFEFGKFGYGVAFIYCACAALRLALFNTLIGRVNKRWFIGIPSPTAAALVAGLIWLDHSYGGFGQGVKWVALLLTLFAGLSMVVQIPFWSFKEINVKRKVPFFAMILLVLALMIIALEPALVLFVFFLGYSLSGYIQYGFRWLKGETLTVIEPVVLDDDSDSISE
ncbi:CDP-diacylglycerol--serine O-phosphatidyltransferase [Alysiella crassa]|uniref:CDP-diacylglycerol--serine O-phosphatidyltransferase n=1 Tax=Alysiella crassa TaxID=153491 RepID=A0A376BKI0_9NEIS|nr:CDP-diacylglycerol--serine O-phosphatidyltransferase [Alysiella crassa]UOP07565.1 CDP-diacylglycerol--serine O-phosphatidyltransferase [Alysiella crassa]SSY70221.1 CDP-diacylglycerol-serine O-phosphatidyltransferase [Alysiella crassa]